MITVRPFQLSDIKTFYEYDLDVEINQAAAVDNDESFYEFKKRYEGLLQYDFNEFPLKIYAIERCNEVIGRLEYRIYEEDNELEFGITIGNKAYWRKGYAQKILEALFKYAFDDLGVKCVIAEVLSSNKASINLMEKLGGKHTETEKDAMKIAGVNLDIFLYRFNSVNFTKKAHECGIIYIWRK